MENEKFELMLDEAQANAALEKGINFILAGEKFNETSDVIVEGYTAK